MYNYLVLFVLCCFTQNTNVQHNSTAQLNSWILKCRLTVKRASAFFSFWFESSLWCWTITLTSIGLTDDGTCTLFASYLSLSGIFLGIIQHSGTNHLSSSCSITLTLFRLVLFDNSDLTNSKSSGGLLNENKIFVLVMRIEIIIHFHDCNMFQIEEVLDNLFDSQWMSV